MKKVEKDYFSMDVESIYSYMKELVPQFMPEWTDTSDDDAGMVILGIIAYALDITLYNMERNAREVNIATARTRRGILNSAKGAGYDVGTQTTAKGFVTIEFLDDYTEMELNYPLLSIGTTPDNNGASIMFETTEPFTKNIGENKVMIPIVQGVTKINELVGESEGLSRTTVLLERDILLDTLTITTEYNGETIVWNRVDNFLESEEDSNHYTVTIVEDNKTEIIFGNGITGAIPPKNSFIYASYRQGGGVQGNLPVGVINTIFTSGFNNYNAILQCYNGEPTSGGSDYESNESIKANVPKQRRTRGFVITRQDAEDKASMQVGVLSAKAVESFTTNILMVYIIMEGLEEPTETDKMRVKEALDEQRVGNVDIRVEGATIYRVRPTIQVIIEQRYDANIVKNAVRDEIMNYYNKDNVQFGVDFYSNKLIDLAFNVKGVVNATKDDKEVPDVKVGETEIFTIDDINIEVSYV